MRQLNVLLAINYESAKVLQNANINVNSEFIEKLKELEKESVRLEVEIDRLKESKLYHSLKLPLKRLKKFKFFKIWIMSKLFKNAKEFFLYK